MPTHILENAEQIQRLRTSAREAAERTAAAMRELLSKQPAIAALARMKFEELGFHPIEDRRLNLIEQVNQTFTYLVSFAAAEEILIRHPGSAPLHLNLGTSPGYDLVSPSQSVVAEVFAAVRRTNNRKLVKDVVKVDSPRHSTSTCSFTAQMRPQAFLTLNSFRKWTWSHFPEKRSGGYR